jgi:hypothetical protein
LVIKILRDLLLGIHWAIVGEESLAYLPGSYGSVGFSGLLAVNPEL